MGRWGKHRVKINILLFTQGFVGQQIQHIQNLCLYLDPESGALPWSRICGITLIQNLWHYLDLDGVTLIQMILSPSVSIIAIHFCQVLRTPTSPNFNVLRIDWPILWQSHPFYPQCTTASFPSLVTSEISNTVQEIGQLTHKTLHEYQPVYLHSLLSLSLSSRSLRSNKGTTPWSLGSRPTQVQEHFTLALLLFGTTSYWSPLNLQPSGSVSGHTSLTWPFLHRYQYTWYPDGPLMWCNCEEFRNIPALVLCCLIFSRGTSFHVTSHVYWHSMIVWFHWNNTICTKLLPSHTL